MNAIRRSVSLALALAGLLALGGCGGGSDNSSTASGGGGDVVVSAAASLKKAFTTYGQQFNGGNVRLSFAGSDELAAQIRQGVKPDVFASANTKLPQQLYAAGLVQRPVRFATNELVLAVPAKSSKVASVNDLTGSGLAIAIGAQGVPVGDYTRTVLSRLPKDEANKILTNVRSNEPDVAGIVGKLTQGAVDAGFVYRSDVVGAGGRLRAIRLPAALQPTVEYGVAVVKGAHNARGAQAFIAGLLAGNGAKALKDNGFGPRPTR
jgi:molybdate transport system substrate-binding protein